MALLGEGMSMETVRLLSHEGSDRQTWLKAWEGTGREPFAHPDYVAIFSAPDETPHVAIVQTTYGTALLPLVLRSIPGAFDTSGNALTDASSPYGYGGPFGTTRESLAEAWSVIADWMETQGIVSLFGRLSVQSPVPDPVAGRIAVRSDADNIVVNLQRTVEEQWAHYEHKVRKNVKKALRAGLTVHVGTAFTDLPEFVALYSATMDRRGAADWYRFDHAFFASLTDQLAGSYVAAEVRDASNRLVSAELVLCSDAYLYSFLGGTLPDAFPHAPNDLLKHEVINYGRDSGRVGYVLGGGYSANDGIFRYKRSFDADGVVPFSRVEIMGSHRTYERLIDLRRAEMLDAGKGMQPAAGYFPAYRAPFVAADEASVSGES